MKRAAQLAALAAVGVSAALLPVASINAQVTRDFTVCFTTGVASCTALSLTTTALFDSFGTRYGSGIDIRVSHAEGSAPGAALTSALTGFGFQYQGAIAAPLGGANVVDAAQTPALFFAEQGAPDPIAPDGWTHQARSSTSASAQNYLTFGNVLGMLSPSPETQLTQAIGGCGVGAAAGHIDAQYSTEVWTCTGGSYRLLTFTDAWFDVEKVNAVMVNTRARFNEQTPGFFASCVMTLDVPTSLGNATDTNVLSDVCSSSGTPAPELPPSTTVPEPSTFVLLATALGLGAFVRRRVTAQRA